LEIGNYVRGQLNNIELLACLGLFLHVRKSAIVFGAPGPGISLRVINREIDGQSVMIDAPNAFDEVQIDRCADRKQRKLNESGMRRTLKQSIRREVGGATEEDLCKEVKSLMLAGSGARAPYPFLYHENGIRDFSTDSEGRIWWGSQPNEHVGYFYLASDRPSQKAIAKNLSK
jgi:hypothetical protein